MNITKNWLQRCAMLAFVAQSFTVSAASLNPAWAFVSDEIDARLWTAITKIASHEWKSGTHARIILATATALLKKHTNGV